MASYGAAAGLVIQRTDWVTAPACFEHFDTPSCQPPTVPTAALFPLCATTVTPNLSLTGVVRLAEYAYGQLRMNAAFPESNAFRASSSWYVVTPCGTMFPTQLRWRLRIAA